jgi:hypothetical protein
MVVRSNDSLRNLITTGQGKPLKGDVTMTRQGFVINFSVDQTPLQAFDAINNVRGWWSENIEGSTSELGDEFTYQHRDVHRCRIKVTELVPGETVVWRVLDNHFNFTQDNREWTGTAIRFDIARKGDQTEIRFAHLGLVREYECFDACSKAWGSYIKGSLRRLIATGKGKPNSKE